MRNPICPVCQKSARSIETQYGTRSYCCNLWSWNGAPLVDELTHEARKAAHAAFDPIWKNGHMSRTQAYKLLSELLGLTSKECHMKLMDFKTARRVPRMSKQIMEAIHECDA